MFHLSKFSLRSFLLTIFLCSCVKKNLTIFFLDFHTYPCQGTLHMTDEKLSRKTCQEKLVHVELTGYTVVNFWKLRSLFDHQQKWKNLNDLEILDVSKSLMNKETAQQILLNFVPLLQTKIGSFNGVIKQVVLIPYQWHYYRRNLRNGYSL